MTTSIIPTFQNSYTVSPQQQDNPSNYCKLQWRRGQLLVKLPGLVKQPYLSSLDKEESLVECLKHSPVSLVCIDPKLGEEKLLLWATACEQASKPIFLHIPSAKQQAKFNSTFLASLKRVTEWLVALMLLLAVSPIVLGLGCIMRVYSPGALFSREWHVGERGKLFRIMKFRTTDGLSEGENDQNITLLGSWMRKWGLENVPQLLNVLRGEMSLIGPGCCTLQNAVRLSLQEQRHLNALPGIIVRLQVETEFQPAESGCGETV
ncbi:MAG: sugar transferase [Cyanomargarita calcarea GSE-NOS-MK-12-04C]|jgi:lipopolysaccharide/colanic/teichoic acid biosynthesis glycosyltransferase|uniref:Sugar transferase n=1 Tax=Cyanomargarita calcarea GSE-NOS-MK-12-04C TaxID=2839659 RepID=A0A951UU76_9CYAN|nr:sugar transferase [Cyanomargarita calcarea GSE-NOS-MK-12-04C]